MVWEDLANSNCKKAGRWGCDTRITLSFSEHLGNPWHRELGLSPQSVLGLLLVIYADNLVRTLKLSNGFFLSICCGVLVLYSKNNVVM